MQSPTPPPGSVTAESSSLSLPAHPEVYINEIGSTPTSVIGVATAVPAFIGYTETAESGGKSVLNQPVLITSQAEFEQTFGAGPQPTYRIQTTPAATPDGFSVVNTTVVPPVTVYFTLEREGARYNLYNSLRLFYANGGGSCYVVSVGSYQDPVQAADLQRGLAAIASQAGPTMLVVPDAVLLPPDDPATPWVSSAFAQVAQGMLQQAASLQDRIAILDVYGTLSLSQPSGAPVLDTVATQFRTAVGSQGLSYGAAYFPFLATTIVAAGEVDLGWIGNTPPAPGQAGILQDILSWEALNLYPDSPGAPSPMRASVQGQIDQIPTTEDVGALDASLRTEIPLLGQMEQRIADDQNVLPPSAALAGVMTQVDAAQGVWFAPANVALAGVAQPTYAVTDTQQQALSLPPDGTAIDVIRAFPSRGVVVWGARTLDGNSNDYRYIQVRRTLIYIEQSIKQALNQFAFSPNTALTWTAATSMVSSFLTGVWSAGGLLGATAADAFSVQCGMGSTMTAADVQEGYMIVQVTLQVIRPAEFIELTFKQKMESAD